MEKRRSVDKGTNENIRHSFVNNPGRKSSAPNKISYARGHTPIIKAIIAIDPKTGKETTYASVKEAAEAFKIHATHISKVLMGRRKTAGKGFTFGYVEKPKKMPAADGTTRDITIASVVKIRLKPNKKKAKKVVE